MARLVPADDTESAGPSPTPVTEKPSPAPAEESRSPRLVPENDTSAAAAPDTIDHTAFVERASYWERVSKAAEAVTSRVKEVYGDQPLSGLDWTQVHLPNDMYNPIRVGALEAADFTAQSFDMVGRAFAAGNAGIGEAMSQAAQGVGSPQGTANQAGRDTAGILNFLMMRGDIGDPGIHRVNAMERAMYQEGVTGQPGPAWKQYTAETVGNLPGPEDFAATTQKIAGIAEQVKPVAHEGEPPVPPSEHVPEVTDGKLRALWEENGIHPNEVLADAVKDPAIAEHLASPDPMLPARYTGIDPERMQAERAAGDKEAGAKTQDIEGITPQLNSALKPMDLWPEAKAADPNVIGKPSVSMSFGESLAKALDGTAIGNIARDLQIKISPMSARDAPAVARAAAKDAANTMRMSSWLWWRIDTELQKNFTPERLKAMWSAADEESVLLHRGESTEGKGLSTLEPKERAVVKALQGHAKQAWDDAKEAGMVKDDAKGRQSYVPRMVQWVTQRGDLGVEPIDPIGRNITDRTGNLKRRKYETTEELKDVVEPRGGQVVEDLRTLPLATARLQRAIAGRRLVNEVRELSKFTEQELVTNEAGRPQNFTIPHPAFSTWERRRTNGPDGKFVYPNDSEGNPIFDRKGMYVDRTFEGPLRAVLSKPDGAFYKALMSAKAKATSYLMYSPLLHNQVIFGRVMPSMIGSTETFTGLPSVTGAMATARLYWEGNKVKQDAGLMTEAIRNGVAPIGKNAGRMDLSGITGEPDLRMPGQSIEAKLLGAIPGLFDKGAGDAVKAWVDKAGDFWHNTLLWDRVGDLQMGLYKHYRDHLLQQGFTEDTAGKAAAHLANRYAGMMSPEAMSGAARKTANLVLFSRSYTLGNIGSLKDMFTGLPRDVLAQIEQNAGVQEMMKVKSWAQRKSIGIVAADMGLYYIGNSLLQSGLSHLMGNDDEPMVQGYLRRLKNTFANVADGSTVNPFNVLNSLTPNSENEPGKQDQILVGYQHDGTAIYAHNLGGKSAGEMIGWLTHPADMVLKKLSTLIKPSMEVLYNRDGLGRHVYNPYPKTNEDYLRNTALIVMHFAEAQFPTDATRAAYELMHNPTTPDEKVVDTAKILGPLFGFQVNHGYPGGAAGSAIAQQKEVDKFNYDQVHDELRSAIKENRMGDARALMTDTLHWNPRQQEIYTQSTLNPSASFVKRGVQKYLNDKPEGERNLIQQYINRGRPGQ